MMTPVFALPWRQLRNDWTKMIAAELRVAQVADLIGVRRLGYIQHSLVFRFPDIVTAEFVPCVPTDRGSPFAAGRAMAAAISARTVSASNAGCADWRRSRNRPRVASRQAPWLRAGGHARRVPGHNVLVAAGPVLALGQGCGSLSSRDPRRRSLLARLAKNEDVVIVVQCPGSEAGKKALTEQWTALYPSDACGHIRNNVMADFHFANFETRTLYL